MTLRILCAGTTEQAFAFVKRTMAAVECEVIKATSLALALFLVQKNFPSLVLCEYDLVGGTALDLFDALKEEDELRDIPFMLLAPENQKGLEQQRQGMQLLEYPISEPVLLATLKPYLVERQDNRPEETPE